MRVNSSLSEPVKIILNKGESVQVEPGAMMAYRGCTLKTGAAAKSIFSALKGYFLVDRPMLQNTFTAENGKGWIMLEEHFPGQVMKKILSPQEDSLMIRGGALIASKSVKLDPKYIGIFGPIAGKGGHFMLQATAKGAAGEVYFHTLDGVVREIKINSEDEDSEPVFVDNNTILAYSAGLDTKVTVAGDGISSYLFSKEGCVCEFRGKGSVYVGVPSEQYRPHGSEQEN